MQARFVLKRREMRPRILPVFTLLALIGSAGCDGASADETTEQPADPTEIDELAFTFETEDNVEILNPKPPSVTVDPSMSAGDGDSLRFYLGGECDYAAASVPLGELLTGYAHPAIRFSYTTNMYLSGDYPPYESGFRYAFLQSGSELAEAPLGESPSQWTEQTACVPDCGAACDSLVFRLHLRTGGTCNETNDDTEAAWADAFTLVDDSDACP